MDSDYGHHKNEESDDERLERKKKHERQRDDLVTGETLTRQLKKSDPEFRKKVADAFK